MISFLSILQINFINDIIADKPLFILSFCFWQSGLSFASWLIFRKKNGYKKIIFNVKTSTQDIETERVVLGALMIDPAAIIKVADFLFN